MNDTAVRLTTNTPTDWLSSSHSVSAAFAKLAAAQSNDMRVKNRRIGALARTSAGIGQKSRASRPASGRPVGTESRNAIATRTVPSSTIRAPR